MSFLSHFSEVQASGTSESRSSEVYSPLSASSTGTFGAAYSDEEVILACNRPKKRAGRKKFKETRHPVYRGVRQRNNDKWVCELREPNKKTRIWLGTFPTAEMAARAHDVAAMALRGRSATLNFADSVWRLPVPDSLDAKDIRKAAAEAAKAFRHSDELEVSSKNCETLEPEKPKENSFAQEQNVFYTDEELEFDMPGLLSDMAQGLLLSPPPSMERGFNWEDMEMINSAEEVSLWSYSI